MGTKTIDNPGGAFGLSALDQELWSDGGNFVTSAAVPAKAVVAIGTDGRVAKAATNGTVSLVIGIADATTTVASAASCRVVLQGIVTGVSADGAIAAGSVLKPSTNTAGYVMATASPAAGEAIGVAIAASASSQVSVWVSPGRY